MGVFVQWLSRAFWMDMVEAYAVWLLIVRVAGPWIIQTTPLHFEVVPMDMIRFSDRSVALFLKKTFDESDIAEEPHDQMGRRG